MKNKLLKTFLGGFFLLAVTSSLEGQDVLKPPICELNKNFISYKPTIKTLDDEEFIPVRELMTDSSPIIFWDKLTNKIFLSCDDLELIFTNNSPLISINSSPYQLSLSPYIKEGTLYVPTNETYSFIANYLLETQKDKVFFPDLSSVSMFGSPECTPSFPKFFFYKHDEKSSLVSIPLTAHLDLLQSIFNLQYSTEVFGDRVFYHLSSDAGISGRFVEEYTDESLAILSRQNFYFVSLTSPKFFTDKLLSIGATKTEVQERYGYPPEGFYSNVWTTINSAEGRGIRFYFTNGLLTKFEYGK